jgi:hypothetical protein
LARLRRFGDLVIAVVLLQDRLVPVKTHIYIRDHVAYLVALLPAL